MWPRLALGTCVSAGASLQFFRNLHLEEQGTPRKGPSLCSGLSSPQAGLQPSSGHHCQVASGLGGGDAEAVLCEQSGGGWWFLISADSVSS